VILRNARCNDEIHSGVVSLRMCCQRTGSKILNNTENVETAVMSKLLIVWACLNNIKRCLSLKEMVMNAVRKESGIKSKRRMGGKT